MRGPKTLTAWLHVRLTPDQKRAIEEYAWSQRSDPGKVIRQVIENLSAKNDRQLDSASSDRLEVQP